MRAFDPIELQRLIDGELSLQEIQRVLETIDSDSIQWKAIATGFIENRMLESHFEAMEAVNTDSITVPDSRHSHATRLPPSWIWSLAASAMLTFSIGMLMGSTYLSNNTSTGSATNTVGSANRLASGGGANTQTSTTPAVYRMQLEDQHGNQFVDTDIPVYQVDNFRDVGSHDFEEYSVDIRNKVRNSGFDLRQDVRYLGGQLRDGRRFVIPIRNTKFAPYQ